MMKHGRKHRFAAALLLLALVVLPPAAAFAAHVSAAADKVSVQEGDTVEITITVSGKAMAVAEGVFSYDPAILTYVESAGGASDGLISMVSAARGGADTLTARIRFTAAGAGNAVIEARINKVLGYDGADQSGAGASVSVAVAPAAPTPAPTPIDYAAKGVAAQNVTGAKEALYIWRSLENVTIPARYVETTLDYHGQTVAAAIVEDSDAPMLLYLSNAAGDAGGYYIYTASPDTLYPYRTVSSVAKTYILLQPDGGVPLPDGFTQTTLTIGENEYTAFRLNGVYLLYARNPDGEVGYYVYNAEDESLQRYVVTQARPVVPTPPEDAGDAGAVVAPSPAPDAPAPMPADGITLGKTGFYLLLSGVIVLTIAVVALLVARSVEKARRLKRAARGQKAGQAQKSSHTL
ncbi:MAG: cohesin domain-containing protein [Clostridiales bacterium]|jgi:heme exporter protein D|nr:cohesin domain-containing protein [Clostridiales bacterium]